jgi:hypothetical protein
MRLQHKRIFLSQTRDFSQVPLREKLSFSREETNVFRITAARGWNDDRMIESASAPYIGDGLSGDASRLCIRPGRASIQLTERNGFCWPPRRCAEPLRANIAGLLGQGMGPRSTHAAAPRERWPTKRSATSLTPQSMQ